MSTRLPIYSLRAVTSQPHNFMRANQTLPPCVVQVSLTCLAHALEPFSCASHMSGEPPPKSVQPHNCYANRTQPLVAGPQSRTHSVARVRNSPRQGCTPRTVPMPYRTGMLSPRCAQTAWSALRVSRNGPAESTPHRTFPHQCA
jgi:hypothetical protein